MSAPDCERLDNQSKISELGIIDIIPSNIDNPENQLWAQLKY